ncbi:MAG TPA: MFS transporter [Chloroflexia bacterium]|nr:MFS transporter [Chloroflexia bacterium]
MRKFLGARQKLYYGWIMLFSLSVTETVSWGILYYTFTVFIQPMQKELGWSRGELTVAFSLALLLSGLAGVPVGRWLDGHGTRALMTTGSVLATLLVLAWSRVNSLPLFYLTWMGIGLTMAAVLYDPAFVVVATWFRRRRGRALTVLTFVAGFASVIFIPLAEWLVQLQGWRGALQTLAVILGLITIPLHSLVLRRKPADLGLLPDGFIPAAESAQNDRTVTKTSSTSSETIPEESYSLREALHSPAFWWLTVSFTLNTLGQVAVMVHLVPYLTDHGYSSGFAASMAGLIGLLALPGRLVFNLLAEHLPRTFLTALIFLLQSLSLVVLLTFQNVTGVFVFVALFGAGFGAITPLRAGLVVGLFGPSYYGRINSVMGLLVTTARGLGPVGVGVAFDITGSYPPLFWLLALISLAAALTITRLPKPPAPANVEEPASKAGQMD